MSLRNFGIHHSQDGKLSFSSKRKLKIKISVTLARFFGFRKKRCKKHRKFTMILWIFLIFLKRHCHFAMTNLISMIF